MCRAMSDVYLNIHRSAQAAGVSPSAPRLWEYRGLVRPQKTPSGHRRYTAEDVGRVRDIRRLRSVQGLNLAAIQGVLGVNGTAPTQRASHGARAVGRALQALRLRRRLTLRQVRDKTGLALSFISSVEHAVGRPSLASLTKLARCYGTTVSALTAGSAPRMAEGVPAGNNRVLLSVGAGVKVEEVAEGGSVLDCQWVPLSPAAGGP